MQVPYAGAVVTVLLVAVLLTPPGELVDRQGAYASQKGDVITGDAVAVELRDGLRSDPGEAVPREIGPWNGTDDDSWPAELEDWLAYDELLVRDYEREGLYFPVQLMVLTARHSKAFHDPQICFDVQGGEVTPLEGLALPAPGPTEAEEVEVGQLHISYPAEDENDTRGPPRLVQNLYVVERHDAAADRTTWIRLSMSGVGEDSADEASEHMIELMEQITPHLFYATGEDRTVAHWAQATYGNGGLVAALGLAAAPLVLHGAWLAGASKDEEEAGPASKREPRDGHGPDTAGEPGERGDASPPPGGPGPGTDAGPGGNVQEPGEGASR